MEKNLAYIFLILISPSILSQNIKWENFKGGIVINHLVTGGDLNKYWTNTPEAGFVINYLLGSYLSAEASISGSYLKPETAESISSVQLPNIFLINMPAGIKYSFCVTKIFSLQFSAGLTNTTFIFTGHAAEALKENNIESEFGFFASTGLSARVSDNFYIELVPGFQKIFSTPSLNLFRTGIKFLVGI